MRAPAPDTIERCAIEVVEAARTVAGRPDQSLLDACLAAGLPMPYNCRSGECGECVARLVRGQVQELPGADPAVFTDAHRARGQVLACLCYPRGDVALSVALRDAVDPAIRETDTVIERVTRVTPTIVEVVARSAAPIAYRAGQYFEWVMPDVAPDRCFSAASRPDTTRLEFHVRLYPGGRVGDTLATGALAAGDILTLRGPFGSFRLSDDDERPAILVAGGTGLAPIKAMLEDAFARASRRPIRFFYGARTATELYHTETFAAWAGTQADFAFVPVLSAEPAGSPWTGVRGLVTDAVAAALSDAFGAEAYLCGPPPMIDAAEALLIRLGVDPADIHADRFTPANQR
jgi:NAD(P)H-flavin reductase/ferredoxin